METARDATAGQVTRIGKYDIVEVLGRGGMGVVYRALDKQLGRDVAIKTLTQGVSGDAEMLARFYEEGRKTARLKHPNIVTVYDLGEDNGIPYIVMERVEGVPLDRVIRNELPLSMIDRLRIVEEVCSALAYAHANGVIHRDVKPANIFVQPPPDRKAKLLDFGIARLENRSQNLSLTVPGHIIGTIPYMAPERLKDRFVDGRSDVFSVGVVLHQLVTGQLPFLGEDYLLMQTIINEPHPPLMRSNPDCPAGLQAIVDRALAKSADDRYQTAEEMASDLAELLEELRHEKVGELLPEARRMMDSEDYLRARAVLQQVLKAHNKNTEARELLSQVQRKLAERQRDERIQNVRVLAEEALSRREYSQALQTLKDGLEKDSQNPDLLALRERVADEKRKQEQIDDFLRRADTARRRGDYQAAVESVQEALKVDKTNSKIIVLRNFLAAEAEQAQKKAQARLLMESVRRQLDAKAFERARELLLQVEELDPAEPEVQLLISDANAGIEEKQRKEAIARLEEQVSLATGLEKLDICAQSIKEAMGTMPAESALIRLSAQVEKRRKELGKRRLVEETFQKCRNLRPREALEVVREARKSLPGEEKLLSLETLLIERIQQQSVGERRAEFLSRAREALKAARYTDAVHILESCKEECLEDPEVMSLLEFARGEESEELRQIQLRSSLEQAQALIHNGALGQAIQFLDGALKQCDDAALRLLFEQSSEAWLRLQSRIETALMSARKFEESGKLEAAIQILRGLPADLQREAKIRMAIQVLEDQRSVNLYRMIGRAYALVDNDVLAAHGIMQRVCAASGEGSVAGEVANAYVARERNGADRALGEAAGKAVTLARKNDKAGLSELIQQTEQVASLASEQAKSTWQSQLGQVKKRGITARLLG